MINWWRRRFYIRGNFLNLIYFPHSKMLDRETLNKFTRKANQGRNQFCVRMYTNNGFSEYIKEKWEPKYYSENPDYFNKTNFWNIVLHWTIIPSLQHWFVLSIARLLDPPFFRNNPDKKNLSIYYIKELLEDNILKWEIQNYLNEQREFIDSIKKLRDTFLAHNNIEQEFEEKKIKSGIELFFENLNKIIIKIKEKYPDLKDCNDLNLKNTDELSEKWVKEIFEKIKIPQP